MLRWTLLLSAGLVASGAIAATQGGFRGPDDVPVVTAAEAAGLPDDVDVRLRGTLARSLGADDYEFVDDSGTLVVEIDDDEWRGLVVDPGTVVVLSGELDRDSDGVELDVDRIDLVDE